MYTIEALNRIGKETLRLRRREEVQRVLAELRATFPPYLFTLSESGREITARAEVYMWHNTHGPDTWMPNSVYLRVPDTLTGRGEGQDAAWRATGPYGRASGFCSTAAEAFRGAVWNVAPERLRAPHG